MINSPQLTHNYFNLELYQDTAAQSWLIMADEDVGHRCAIVLDVWDALPTDVRDYVKGQQQHYGDRWLHSERCQVPIHEVHGISATVRLTLCYSPTGVPDCRV